MQFTFFSGLSWTKAATGALGFALFRIVYAGVLLLELQQLFNFRGLIFADSVLPAAFLKVLLPVWGLALCFLMAGWRTRPAAWLNYLASVVVVWGIPDFKYHFDYIMISVNFLLLWLPVSQVFSLDAGWKKRKTGYAAPGQVSEGWVYLLAVPALGLVYLDSVFYKFSSPMWRQGLGFWLPSSLPQNAQTDLSWILNQEVLVKAIGYGIMVFEALFLLLIWFKRFRLLLVVGGLLLHAGIGMAYPLSHFGLAMMALYLPLIPDSFWQGLRRIWFRLMGAGQPAPRLMPDLEMPLLTKRQIKLGSVFLLYCGLGQLLCLTLSPLFQVAFERLHLTKEVQTLQQWSKPAFFFNQKFLGLVPHDIFLDKHFKDYHRLVSLWYVPGNGPAVPLPLLRETGQPGSYCSGRIWTKWVYRVTSPGADPQEREAGIRHFSAYWLASQGVPAAQQALFEVRTKAVEVPVRWQADHLKKQLHRSWQPAGTIRWQAQRYRLQLPGL